MCKSRTFQIKLNIDKDTYFSHTFTTKEATHKIKGGTRSSLMQLTGGVIGQLRFHCQMTQMAHMKLEVMLQ